MDYTGLEHQLVPPAPEKCVQENETKCVVQFMLLWWFMLSHSFSHTRAQGSVVFPPHCPHTVDLNDQ